MIGRFLLLGLYGGIVLTLLTDYFPEDENEDVDGIKEMIHWIFIWILWSLPFGFFKILPSVSGGTDDWCLFQSEEEEPDHAKGSRKFNWLLVGGFTTMFSVLFFMLFNSMLQWVGIDFWVLGYFK